LHEFQKKRYILRCQHKTLTVPLARSISASSPDID
jgi:hypothetical protein